MINQLKTPLPQLSGIKVVELGQNLAGPFAACIFGDLGAEVIKIEKPGGDDSRGWGPPFVEDLSITFHLMNRNKKSVVLALDQEADLATFMDLIADADVFLHNLRPGVEEKLGIGPKTLMKANPRLIYCATNAFGHAGPMQMKPGYEPLLQAFSGLVSVNGDPSGPASRIGPSVVDMGTGMWTVIGVLSALLERERTGKGSLVQTSLFETALCWASRHVGDYGATGKIPPRMGTGHNSLTPFQAFDCADGPIMIAAGNDRLFVKLANELGHPEWVQDPRYATNAERTRNRDTLVPLIAAILRGKGAAEWAELLDKAGVPCAPIHNVPQAVEHAQTRSLGILLDSGSEQLKIVGLPLSIGGQRPGFGKRAPALGEHQDEVARAVGKTTR